jgi:hypothetical protein
MGASTSSNPQSLPWLVMVLLFLTFLLLRVISSSRRLRLTQQTSETNTHSLSGIRIRDPSSRAAADLRRRPLGHQDGQRAQFCAMKYEQFVLFNVICVRC